VKRVCDVIDGIQRASSKESSGSQEVRHTGQQTGHLAEKLREARCFVKKK
jgi:hypothetical protein